MPKHGETKELTVIKTPPSNYLGSSFFKLGNRITGWWDKEADYGKGKWKIDYGNGFVGYWDDYYFFYEDKGFLYKLNGGGFIISPIKLFYGAMVSNIDSDGITHLHSVTQVDDSTVTLEYYTSPAIEVQYFIG